MFEVGPVWVFVIIGLIFVVAELLLAGAAGLWCLFIGCVFLVATLVINFLGTEDWMSSVLILLGATAVFFLIFYKKIRSGLGINTPKETQFLGQTAVVVEEMGPGQLGMVSWSDCRWPAKLAADTQKSVVAGEAVTIESVQGIQLIVRKCDG